MKLLCLTTLLALTIQVNGQTGYTRGAPDKITRGDGQVKINANGSITIETADGQPIGVYGAQVRFDTGPLVLGALSEPDVSGGSDANLYWDGSTMFISKNGGSYVQFGGVVDGQQIFDADHVLAADFGAHQLYYGNTDSALNLVTDGYFQVGGILTSQSGGWNIDANGAATFDSVSGAASGLTDMPVTSSVWGGQQLGDYIANNYTPNLSGLDGSGLVNTTAVQLVDSYGNSLHADGSDTGRWYTGSAFNASSYFIGNGNSQVIDSSGNFYGNGENLQVGGNAMGDWFQGGYGNMEDLVRDYVNTGDISNTSANTTSYAFYENGGGFNGYGGGLTGMHNADYNGQDLGNYISSHLADGDATYVTFNGATMADLRSLNPTAFFQGGTEGLILVDTGWVANTATADKTIVLANFSNVGPLNALVGGAGTQIQNLTQKVAAIEATLANSERPNN